jgi:hypothetical protein
MTMATDYIRNGNRAIKQNVWDNWYGYEGGRRVIAFANDPFRTSEQSAEEWLNDATRVRVGIVVPTVHLGGTSGNELMLKNFDAFSAVCDAIAKVQDAAPHGRDYPNGSESAMRATSEHARRLKALEAVKAELQVIHDTVAMDIEERAAFKGVVG